MVSDHYPNHMLIRELLEDVVFNATDEHSIRVPLQGTKWSREYVERHLCLSVKSVGICMFRTEP